MPSPGDLETVETANAGCLARELQIVEGVLRIEIDGPGPPRDGSICLWALQRYRAWSHRLARPDLAPLADRVIAIIASRWYLISGLLGLRGSDRELMDVVQEVRARETALGASCETGCLTVGREDPEPKRDVNIRDPDRPGSAWHDRPPPR